MAVYVKETSEVSGATAALTLVDGEIVRSRHADFRLPSGAARRWGPKHITIIRKNSNNGQKMHAWMSERARL